MSAYWISAHTGNPNDPLHLGRHPDFVRYGYDWMIDMTLAAYSRGHDEVVWHQVRGNPMIAGSVPVKSQDLYPSACGRAVHTPEEIAVLDRRMHELPKAPTMYTGVWVHRLDSLVIPQGMGRYPDPRLAADANFLANNWEMWLAYGVRKIILDNSVVDPLRFGRLAAYFATRGVVLGTEGWQIDWAKKAFSGLSWKHPSYHLEAVVRRHDPEGTLAVRPPHCASHSPTVVVQRTWDAARGMVEPAEEVASRVMSYRDRQFLVDFAGNDHPVIRQAMGLV